MGAAGRIGCALLVALLAACSSPAAPPPAAPPPDPTPTASRADRTQWRQVWADEFDGTELDLAKWTPDRDSTFGDGNGELACLTDRPENLTVGGGVLTLTARREARPYRCGRDRRFPGGREFTAALISTRDTASWTYGRFEIRAKVPTVPGRSAGLWPAFWMRPVDGGVGEIDILETVGTADPARQPVLTQTIAYDYQGTHPREKAEYSLPPGVASSADDFHSHAVEWDPDEIRWYVDDVQTYVRNRTTTPWFDEAFARPFFLRVNLAVGGDFPGRPTADTEFPASYVIDSVRVSTRVREP